MSEWLQITGSIRLGVQDIKKDGDFEERRKSIEKGIGKISTYENPVKTTLPSGSEGSIEWTLIDDTVNRYKSDNLSYSQNATLVLNGGLRDRAGAEKLEEWLNSKVKGSNDWGVIIDGVVQAYTSYSDELEIFTFYDNSWHKEIIEMVYKDEEK